MTHWKGYRRKWSWTNLNVNIPALACKDWEKTTRNLSQVYQYMGQDLNLGPTEYEAGMSTTWSQCTVWCLCRKTTCMWTNPPEIRWAVLRDAVAPLCLGSTFPWWPPRPLTIIWRRLQTGIRNQLRWELEMSVRQPVSWLLPQAMPTMWDFRFSRWQVWTWQLSGIQQHAVSLK
jgi:hypothetical protein